LSQEILALCAHTEQDAFLALGLMFKLVILPLTRQLTCLCGNLWSVTLALHCSARELMS